MLLLAPQQVGELADKLGQAYGPFAAITVVLVAAIIMGLSTAVWHLWKQLCEARSSSREELIAQSQKLRELQGSTRDALNETVQILKQMRSESSFRDEEHSDDIETMIERIRELSDDHDDILREVQ